MYLNNTKLGEARWLVNRWPVPSGDKISNQLGHLARSSKLPGQWKQRQLGSVRVKPREQCQETHLEDARGCQEGRQEGNRRTATADQVYFL